MSARNGRNLRDLPVLFQKDLETGVNVMTKIPLSPLGDFVVALQEAAQTKTASGLFLPDSTGEKPKIAEVLAVGPLVKDVKVGDKIVFGGYSNSDIKVDGIEYMLVKNENIYAKVN